MNRFFRRNTSIAEALARLDKYDYAPELLARLGAYLHASPPAALDHIHLGDLRGHLDLDERASLELLVAAVHEGLFDLYWEAYCTHCGMLGKEWSRLEEARHTVHCAACGQTSEVTLDRNLRVRFALNHRYRARRLTDRPRLVPALPAEGLSGLEMLNIQAFRDLLADQVIPVNESLAVMRLALLFTDLRGSTALYARKGDPAAYRLVREHYVLVSRIVRAQRGAVVKTAGDGIMASFGDPGTGLRAALTIQDELGGFNRQQGLQGDDALLLKLGLHAGPCLSVNLNGRMDYFGTTVNIASRVEGLSQGGDVVTTAAVLREAGAHEVLAEAVGRGAQLAESRTTLRGFAEPIAVTRIALASAAHFGLGGSILPGAE